MQFELMGKNIRVIIEPAAISLWLDGCVRKRRDLDRAEPIYLWTNVELMWEEHRLIEVRYWQSSGRLLVCINGRDIQSMSEVTIRTA